MSWRPLADMLLRRGQLMAARNQHKNVWLTRDHLAAIAEKYELTISHGKGPQIEPLLQRAIGNRVPFDKPPALRLSVIEIDPGDSTSEAGKLPPEQGRTFKPNGGRHALRSGAGTIGIDHGPALATDVLWGTRTQPSPKCSVPKCSVR